MNFEKWFLKNTASLEGKTVAITGSTGGLGNELCRYLARLGASIILLDRNPVKSKIFADKLRNEFNNVTINCITLDLENFSEVKRVTELLKLQKIDIFIHNAGAYSIPRHKCDTGLDNVFQINFTCPYYMIRTLLPYINERVIAVGSIAHNYSISDPDDIDFSTRNKASLVYGNAKRYLMFALSELFKNEKRLNLAIVHPGITFTNITAHYPKVIFALIKYPMKIIFMSPKKAALCLLKGVFENCEYNEWIGPCVFDIWGLPKKKSLKSAKSDEAKQIFNRAEKLCKKLCDM